MIEVVPATREIMQDEFDGMQAFSVKAKAIIEDGEVICVMGTYMTCGNVVGFMKATDKARCRPKLLFKTAKQIFESKKGRILAYCDMNIDGADRFLRHLGFECIGGDIWLGHR